MFIKNTQIVTKSHICSFLSNSHCRHMCCVCVVSLTPIISIHEVHIYIFIFPLPDDNDLKNICEQLTRKKTKTTWKTWKTWKTFRASYSRRKDTHNSTIYLLHYFTHWSDMVLRAGSLTHELRTHTGHRFFPIYTLCVPNYIYAPIHYTYHISLAQK